MSESPKEESPKEPKKGSKLKMLILAVLILGAGGGAGFASYSGLIDIDQILGSGDDHAGADGSAGDQSGEFVALPELIIPLGSGAKSRFLRAVIHLEVAPGASEKVKILEPRVLDVLNTFLRAVEERDLESTASFARIQAQILRRVQLVAGKDDIRDVLVGEFILH